jgi:LacI family transcriptional regulator
MAMGCFNAIQEAGLDIPGDISVIGYDDDELARHLRPQLTTLELPHRGMGAWAVRQLERGAFPNTGTYPLHKIACSLVQRASVTKLA